MTEAAVRRGLAVVLVGVGFYLLGLVVTSRPIGPAVEPPAPTIAAVDRGARRAARIVLEASANRTTAATQASLAVPGVPGTLEQRIPRGGCLEFAAPWLPGRRVKLEIPQGAGASPWSMLVPLAAAFASGGARVVMPRRRDGVLRGRVLGDGEFRPCRVRWRELCRSEVGVFRVPPACGEIIVARDGSFRGGGIPAGATLEVVVEYEKRSTGRRVALRVRRHRVATRAGVTDVVFSAYEARVAGVVVDGRGRPRPGVRVTYREASRVSLPAPWMLTDSHGRFAFCTTVRGRGRHAGVVDLFQPARDSLGLPLRRLGIAVRVGRGANDTAANRCVLRGASDALVPGR